jgi:hypothetical protein
MSPEPSRRAKLAHFLSSLVCLVGTSLGKHRDVHAHVAMGPNPCLSVPYPVLGLQLLLLAFTYLLYFSTRSTVDASSVLLSVSALMNFPTIT